MVRGFKMELDPNVAQCVAFAKGAGVARFAYNWGLETKQKAYREEGRSLSAIDLNKLLVARKHDSEDLPWLAEVSKWIPAEALRDLEQAYAHFFRRHKEGKRGKKVGFPQFKKKFKDDSFRLYQARVVDRRYLHLPLIGSVRSKEPLDQVVKALALGGELLFVTVSRQADKWYASLQVRVDQTAYERARGRHTRSKSRRGVAGVDVGIKTLAVVSTVTKAGGTVEREYLGPRALEQELRKLRRLNRELSRREQGSANWRKTRVKLARLHRRIANVRLDHSHKLSRQLARSKRVVVREDLVTTNMLQNKRQARRIQDCAWGQLDRLLEYKCEEEEGSLYLECDRFYPSSKTCSGCGFYHAEFGREDVFTCPSCGLRLQRDVNAARNLGRLGQALEQEHMKQTTASAAGSDACGETSSGLDNQVNLGSLIQEGAQGSQPGPGLRLGQAAECRDLGVTV